jgi:hypothetical protein
MIIRTEQNRNITFNHLVALIWTGHVAQIGEKRNAYRILVGKPEGRRPLRRSRRKWMDNIKIDIRDVEWDVMD